MHIPAINNGEMLPSNRNQFFLSGRGFERHEEEFYCGEGKARFPNVWEKTEANARAKMLIYLLENKMITNNP